MTRMRLLSDLLGPDRLAAFRDRLRRLRLPDWSDDRERRAAIGFALGLLALVACVLWLTRERMPDFREYEAGPDRKSAFFAFVRPLVEAENGRILEERERLLEIAEDRSIGWLERGRVGTLAENYGLDPEEMEDDEALLDALLRRVDVVPVSLALAQAAKESGWGTSRFARRGYNLFGEWCYEPGCGLVPRSRDSGRSHEVRAFDSPRDSVLSYLRNINTNRSYRELRRKRAALRAGGKPLSGLILAGQLHRYSERGQAYIDDIRGLIRVNDLEDGGA